MKQQVIAIDGPAGSGKSTAARGVARALGLGTLDTGAMYRAVTLAVMEAGVGVDDGAAAAAVAEWANVEVEAGKVCLDGRDVSDDIRGPEVTAAVSAVSAHPAVRRILVERQRDWVREHGGGVVEGRDIGTVVFPDAPVKVFLTARDDVRGDVPPARRGSGRATSPSTTCATRSTARDRADSSLGRALRPEDAADDAMVIDTSTTDVDDVVDAIVRRARTVATR